MSIDQTEDPKANQDGLSRRAFLGAMAAVSAGALVGTAAPASASIRPGTPRRPVLPVHPSQPEGPVLTLLGTSGGPPPDYVRTGTSSVLTVEGYNYVVDCGRNSVTQYLNAGLRFSRLAGIFITHLHADHLADYYNYFMLASLRNSSGDELPGPVPAFGPGSAGALPSPVNPPVKTIAPQDPTPGLTDLTNKLTEGFAYSHNIFIREDGATPITSFTSKVQDIVLPPNTGASALGNTALAMKPFRIYQDDRVEVSAILVPHGLVFPSFAFRFDTEHGSVVFSGDTRLSDNIITLAQGADVLVHEVLDYEFYKLRGADSQLLEHFRTAHTFSTQVGFVARRAGVGQLVLTHLDPSNPAQFPDADYLRKAKLGFSGPVLVANDLDRVPLWGARRPSR